MWHSPAGVGLYVSILFRPERPIEELPRWTLAAALAACEAVRQTCGVDVRIKWPNDLLWGRAKVGGVLAEIRSAGGSVSELVVGTGINVNHRLEDFSVDIRGRATSLRIARGDDAVDRESLLVAYLGRWAPLRTALSSGVWNHVADAWMRHAPEADGSRVRVTGPEGAASIEGFVGTTRGIDDCGALRVQRDDGVVVALRHGESVAPAEG